MDGLHHDLEAVETTGLSGLNLVRETLDEALVDNAIGGGGGSRYMRDEMVFVVIERVCPVSE